MSSGSIDPSCRHSSHLQLPTGTELLHVAVLLASAFAIFFLGFRIDGQPAQYDLDPSWSAVMSWGLIHGAQWGRDLVFTYGPLSFLSQHFSYFPSVFALATVAQLAFASLYGLLLVAVFRSAALPLGVMLLLTLAVFGDFFAGEVLFAAVYALSAIALLNAEFARPRPTFFVLAVAGVLTAVPPLAKISFLPLWLAWGVLVLCSSTPLKYRLFLVGISVATSLMFWLLAGQALTAIPDYFQANWQIIGGYGAGMQRPGFGPLTDTAGLATLFFSLASTTLLLRKSSFHWRSRASLALTLALTALFAYRAGFTRVDEVHLLIFFPLIPLLLVIVSTVARPVRVIPLALGLTIPLFAMSLSAPDISPVILWRSITGSGSAERISENIRILTHWTSFRAAREQQLVNLRKQLDLPETRTAVGGESIDIFKIGQGIVLLNNFNYAPRPVFQAYSAYTDELSKIDANYLRSTSRPQWMLFDLTPVDRHLPASEDPLALLAILENYTIALEERGLLLFHRIDPLPTLIDKPLVHESLGSFGSQIPVPSVAQEGLILQIDLKKTLRNRLASLLIREPRLFVELTLETGSVRLYRLMPDATRSGFIISPSLVNNEELKDWLSNGVGQTIKQIRLLSDPAFGGDAFDDGFQMKWTAYRLRKNS